MIHTFTAKQYRERQRERERDRQTDRQTETDRQAGRKTESHHVLRKNTHRTLISMKRFVSKCVHHKNRNCRLVRGAHSEGEVDSSLNTSPCSPTTKLPASVLVRVLARVLARVLVRVLARVLVRVLVRALVP